jgi:hypothetical protein
MTACKYHLQSLNPLVVVRYPNHFLSCLHSIILFITSSITIWKIMRNKMHPWLTPIFNAMVLDNLLSCTTWHVIHYFQRLFPIYGIKTLFKIYKHQIKICQVLHTLFHDYTLFILSLFILLGPHVMWVPCHHSMAHPQFADGEDSLQQWRVAANKLNK